MRFSGRFSADAARLQDVIHQLAAAFHIERPSLRFVRADFGTMPHGRQEVKEDLGISELLSERLISQAREIIRVEGADDEMSTSGCRD